MSAAAGIVELGVAEELEGGVGVLSVLDDVEALQFGLGRNAEDAELLQREEDRRTRAEGPGGGAECAERLDAEELEAAAVEETDELVAVAASRRIFASLRPPPGRSFVSSTWRLDDPSTWAKSASRRVAKSPRPQEYHAARDYRLFSSPIPRASGRIWHRRAALAAPCISN